MREPADRADGAECVTPVRVRYAETDRMRVAWHGHYLSWYEAGRTELMRALGCPYGETEDRDGVYFPVIEAGCRYLSPALYDETLDVRTRLTRVGGARVRFEYRLTRGPRDELLATGYTVHAAVAHDGRPTRMPRELRRRLAAGLARGAEAEGELA